MDRIQQVITVTEGQTFTMPLGVVGYAIIPKSGAVYTLSDGYGGSITEITLPFGSPQNYTITNDNMTITATTGTIGVTVYSTNKKSLSEYIS